LRGRVMGLFEVATFGGTIGGILIGGPLFQHFQNHAFTWDAAIYLTSLLILYLGMVELGTPRAKPGDSIGPAPRQQWLSSTRSAFESAYGGIRIALTSGPVLRFAPAWLAINMLPGLWLNNVTGLLMSPGHRFQDQLLFGLLAHNPNYGNLISLGGGIVLGLFTSGIVLWTLVISRFRRTSLMLVCATGLPFVALAIWLINHSGNLQQPLIPFYLGIAMLGLMVVSGFTPAALTYLADLTEHSPVNRGAIMGLYTVLFGLGQFIGGFLGGPFGDWRGMDGLLLLTFLLGLSAFGTVGWLHLTEAQRK